MQQEKKGDFKNFQITPETIKTLQTLEITYLFPIQASSFPQIFSGKSIIGRDRTGSGKTLAFSLPILEKLRSQNLLQNKQTQKPFVIIIVPTRELCLQVTRVLNSLKNREDEFRVLSIYGGTPYFKQTGPLKSGVEIVVGTPGRIMDLQEKGNLSLGELRVFILDETDQMLKFGFQEDIERILNKGKEDNEGAVIQYLLFSATIPDWVEEIAAKFMGDSEVEIIDMVKNSEIKTSKTVQHWAIQFYNEEEKKKSIKNLMLCYGKENGRTIIFTERKIDADNIKNELTTESINIERLHGDVSQPRREIIFNNFRNGSLKCLVATNVAARGLDIPSVDLIIQLSPPREIDAYIHRSGRTGRAGKKGICITLFSNKEKMTLDKISNLTKVKFEMKKSPSFEEIMIGNSRVILRNLDSVRRDDLEKIEGFSKDVFSKYKPAEGLCRALAIICKTEDMIKKDKSFGGDNGFRKNRGRNSNQGFGNKSSSWGDKNDKWNSGSNNYSKNNDNYSKNNYSKNNSNYNRNNDYGTKEKDYQKLYIGNLGYEVGVEDLKNLVKNGGFYSEDIFLVNDRETGKSKGFGYVQFGDEDTAKSAFEFLQNESLFGRSLKVNYANKK